MKCCIRRLSVFSFLLSGLMLSGLPLYSCPMCKEAIGVVTGLSQGFAWSILLMLAVPFLVVAIITGAVVIAHRSRPPL